MGCHYNCCVADEKRTTTKKKNKHIEWTLLCMHMSVFVADYVTFDSQAEPNWCMFHGKLVTNFDLGGRQKDKVWMSSSYVIFSKQCSVSFAGSNLFILIPDSSLGCILPTRSSYHSDQTLWCWLHAPTNMQFVFFYPSKKKTRRICEA